MKRSLASVAAGSEDVELVFPELARLAYRAVDRASGDALKTYALLWRPAGVGEALLASWDGKTDEGGYREALLPVGSVDLYLHTGEHVLATRDGVRLEAGGETARVSFELDRGHEVVIQLDPAGRPPSGAWIALPRAEHWSDLGCTRSAAGIEPTSGGRFPARAVPVLRFFDEGRCTVRGLTAGTYRFKVFEESMTLDPDTIQVPSADGAPVVVRWTLDSR